MSINISVGANGATTGRSDQIIPGDGGIDTKEEAEAALTYVPEGSTNTVVAGGQTYTRAQLIEIRDRTPADAANKGEPIPGEGVSHGVGLEGHGLADSGEVGHGGQGANLTYRLGVPLVKSSGGHQLHLDVIAGPQVGHYSRGFTTPGGEAVNSAFTRYGALLGFDGRYSPPILANRLFVAFGMRGGLTGLSTKESATVSTPGKCTPGDLGRSECEPSAGPRTGNAGTEGLWNPRVGSAAGTSGVVMSLDFPLTLGGTVVRGEFGSVDLFGGPVLSVKKVMPSGGDGFGFSSWGGFGGAVVRFGGSAAYKTPETPAPVPTPVPVAPPPADKDGDGVPDSDDKCPDVKGTKENAGCPAYDASVTSSPASVKAQEKFLVGLKVGSASKVRVAFRSEDGTLNNSNSIVVDEGNSKSEFAVPAELKAGKYKLVITFEDMTTHVKKVEEKDIVIVENVSATLPGSFAPGQPPTIQNVKVNGMEKLEGVSYVIEGFDKDKKSIGTQDSGSLAKGDKAWNLDEKKGTRIPLAAPGTKGFQKDINYVVTLKNKEGLPVWTGSFEVGQAAPIGGRKVKPK